MKRKVAHKTQMLRRSAKLSMEHATVNIDIKAKSPRQTTTTRSRLKREEPDHEHEPFKIERPDTDTRM